MFYFLFYFFLVILPDISKLEKANMLLLSKEMTDKDKSMKTQLLLMMMITARLRAPLPLDLVQRPLMMSSTVVVVGVILMTSANIVIGNYIIHIT